MLLPALVQGCSTGQLDSHPNGHCDHKHYQEVLLGLIQQSNYFVLGKQGGGIFFKMDGGMEVKEVN